MTVFWFYAVKTPVYSNTFAISVTLKLDRALRGSWGFFHLTVQMEEKGHRAFPVLYP